MLDGPLSEPPAEVNDRGERPFPSIYDVGNNLSSHRCGAASRQSRAIESIDGKAPPRSA